MDCELFSAGSTDKCNFFLNALWKYHHHINPMLCSGSRHRRRNLLSPRMEKKLTTTHLLPGQQSSSKPSSRPCDPCRRNLTRRSAGRASPSSSPAAPSASAWRASRSSGPRASRPAGARGRPARPRRRRLAARTRHLTLPWQPQAVAAAAAAAAAEKRESGARRSRRRWRRRCVPCRRSGPLRTTLGAAPHPSHFPFNYPSRYLSRYLSRYPSRRPHAAGPGPAGALGAHR